MQTPLTHRAAFAHAQGKRLGKVIWPGALVWFLTGCTPTPPEPNVLMGTAVVGGAYALYQTQTGARLYKPDYYQTAQLDRPYPIGDKVALARLRCQQHPSECLTQSQVRQKTTPNRGVLSVGQPEPESESNKDMTDLFISPTR